MLNKNGKKKKWIAVYMTILLLLAAVHVFVMIMGVFVL